MKPTADVWVDKRSVLASAFVGGSCGIRVCEDANDGFLLHPYSPFLALAELEVAQLSQAFIVEWHLGRGRLGVGPRKLIPTAKETTVSPVPGPRLPCTSKSPAHNSGHFLLLSSQCHWLPVSL